MSPHPPPSLLYVVKRLESSIRSHLDEILKTSGITALQYTALTVLERHDGLSSAQLARDSFVTAQSTADLVSALERRGLITRNRDPDNRRVLLISLTDAGRAILDEYREAVRELEDRMTGALTVSQSATFRKSLERCREALAPS